MVFLRGLNTYATYLLHRAFQQLQQDCNLPSNYTFYYYQLRHAIRAQFGSLDNPVQVPPLEKMLGWPDPAKLISVYYSALVTDCNCRLIAAQVKWTSLDIPLNIFITPISARFT